MDGLDNNDQTFGYAFTSVLRSTLDSTQEYRVTTANSNADAGRSSGAQVTLVTPGATPSPTQTFPYALPQTNAAGSSCGISWGVDNRIKTPYAEVFNLSVERALPGGFIFEAAYVGRFGRRLIQQLDLATPLNLLDPKSGSTYFQAGAQLAAAVDQNAGNAKATVASIPYFENMFPQLASVSNKNCRNASHTATQAIYCNEFAAFRKVLGRNHRAG